LDSESVKLLIGPGSGQQEVIEDLSTQAGVARAVLRLIGEVSMVPATISQSMGLSTVALFDSGERELAVELLGAIPDTEIRSAQTEFLVARWLEESGGIPRALDLAGRNPVPENVASLWHIARKQLKLKLWEDARRTIRQIADRDRGLANELQEGLP
jgi:hypothetical protein